MDAQTRGEKDVAALPSSWARVLVVAAISGVGALLLLVVGGAWAQPPPFYIAALGFVFAAVRLGGTRGGLATLLSTILAALFAGGSVPAGTTLFVAVGSLFCLWPHFHRSRLDRRPGAGADADHRFRVVADSAPIMIFRADTSRRLLWANRAWLAFRGHELAAELALDWTSAVHDADRVRVRSALDRRSDAGAVPAIDFRMRDRDGVERWLSCTAVPESDTNGGIAGYTGFVRNIDIEKEFERLRGQMQAQADAARDAADAARAAAEAAMHSKDEFLAKVSHELRNPLNGILGWTHVLRSGDSSAAEIGRGLSMIDSAARALAQLVEGLLDLSRGTTGRLALALQPTDFKACLEAACANVRAAADAKGVALACDFAEGLPKIDGDAGRLQQIGWNLLANGVKFTPRGGSVHADLRQHGDFLTLTVRDTGIGIPPDFLPHVFSPFRQAESSTTRRYEGTGLGLAIARQLTELHGGTIAAHSDGTGHGSTFVVNLPMVHAAEDTVGDAQGPTPARDLLKGVRILVLDDDPAAREFLLLMLARVGAMVREASSVPAALSAVKSQHPDVVLSDIEMPGEDGYAFVRQLRRLPPAAGGRTPAIAVTAFAHANDRGRARTAGFQDYVTKPIDADQLLATVHRVVHEGDVEIAL